MKDFSVRVPGTNFTLSSNSTYRVEGKVSTHSPKEFQEAGFTKIPNPFSPEQAKVKFDQIRKVWDTGFYENSPCYLKNKISKDDVKEIVKTLNENLVPELEEFLPEGSLSPKESNDYFDDYKYEINQKNNYTTNTPLEFWGLWNALIDYVVAPVDDQKKPIYRDAMISTPFVIYDGTRKKNQEQDNTFEKIKSSSTFMTMLTSKKPSDKELLVDVCNYVGFRLSDKTADKVAISQFENWISNSQNAKQNVSQFNLNIDYFSSSKNKEELNLYSAVKNALKEGLITKDREELYLAGQSLGMEIKGAAKIINTNKELKKTLLEAMS